MMIKDLEQDYQTFVTATSEASRDISDAVSMLDLEGANEAIASAVLEIDSLTSKGRSTLQKIPFFGKYLAKAATEADKTNLTESGVGAVVDRLFNALSNKKSQIEEVVESLFTLKDKLEAQVEGLAKHEGYVQQLVETDLKSIEAFHAKNLLVQIQPTLIKAKDRLQTVNITIQAAAVCAQKISAMLPQLQTDLLTEMNIQASLNSLRDFQRVYDATLQIIEEVSAANDEIMTEVLLDVADLGVNKPSPTQLARMEQATAKRIQVTNEVRAKMEEGMKAREAALASLAEARLEQDNAPLLKFYAPGDD